MYDLRPLTTNQLVRLYRRVWKRMTMGQGYQPYGWDAATLWAIMPSWMKLRSAIMAEGCRQLIG